MAVHFHEEDLPEGALAAGAVAVDTETMGLRLGRDRLCVVQIADGRGDEHLVRFGPGSDYAAPNLRAVLTDPGRLKLYHFARFDIASIQRYLGVVAAPVYCTKTASRLIRTYTDRHGLKELVKELLQTEISKQQQTSDWGAPELSDAQKDYAASDVRYLHQLKERLDERLAREGRTALAQACFDFLRTARCSIWPGARRIFSRMSEAALVERTRKQGWAAPGGMHDFLVRFLKVALPAAIGVLMAFLALAPLNRGQDISFLLDKNKVELTKDRLRVAQARYRGQDDRSRPFLLSAENAAQASGGDPVVTIQNIRLRCGSMRGWRR
jgi:ribonuclease D